MLTMGMPGKYFLKSLAKRVITIVVTWNVIVACLVLTLALLSGIVVGMAGEGMDSDSGLTYAAIYGTGSQELLSIKVSGVIVGTDAAGSSLFSTLDSQTAGYTVKDALYAAADDDLVKGVILEIDSPGGTIFGAHAIADGVAYYKEKTKKPVYAHISGSGASGAYWAAVSADKVVVDYGSDVGSIGVIMGPFQYYNKVLAEDGGILSGGVVTENGIENVMLTAGKSKDIGNPYRKLTTEEVAGLQKTVDNEYANFVSYVAERRHIPEADIRGKIGAMIYDPQSALDLKLVDAIGSRQDAYEQLAKAAKIDDDYFISQEQYLPGFVESLLGVVTRKPQLKAQSVDLCKLTGSSLAYHGDVTAWCQK